MNDRQRLEAIVAVVCKYLPPDGISREQAMNEIIGLIDPLPAQLEQAPVVCCQQYDTCLLPCTPRGERLARRTWVGLTDEQIDACWNKDLWKEKQPHHIFAKAIESKLKEKNGYAEEKNT